MMSLSKSKQSKSAPTMLRTRLCSRSSKRLVKRSRLGRRMAFLLKFKSISYPHFQLSIFSHSSGTDSPFSASSIGDTGRLKVGDGDGLISDHMRHM